MGTMSYGYYYDRGVRVGYDISFGNFILFNVSSKDKNRLVREIKQAGYAKDEITVKRQRGHAS